MNSLSQAVWQNKKQHVVLVVRAVSSEEKSPGFKPRQSFLPEVYLCK